MPKGSAELTNARKEEIVNACEQLYKKIGFKEITLKEIAKVTSFTRTSIYNYFQTKEEIFVEILKREYELWIDELQQMIDENEQLSRSEFAEKIARSLENREQLLKILSMNMYDMEENSRMENLVEFKKIYGKSMQTMLICVGKFFPESDIAARQTFLYQFFPFVYGIYPYTEVTEKQREAMKEAGIDYTYQSIYEITYGGMSFGRATEDFHLWTLDQEHTTAMIAHATELGVNFIDTANCYAHGTSEEYIGNAIKKLEIPREKIVLASKVYFNEGKLSKEAINREIDGTLKRLGTDYLDLYQIHRFDYDTPMEETMETLNNLIKVGKVRAIGASAMYGYQFHNMQVIAEKNGWNLFATMQNHYNLLYREDERELIPVCEQYQVSRIPYSPLAGGHLTHAGWTTTSKRSQTDQAMKRKYDQAMENDLMIIARVEKLAKKYEVSMTQIALAWQFKKGVTAPIVGATNVPHFDDAVKSVNLDITDEDVVSLEELYARHKVVGALPEE